MVDPFPRSAPRVAIIIVTYDARRHLAACLGAVAAIRYPADLVEVVVVDDGPEDHAADLVRTRFPEVRTLRCPENNYCKANNQGIAATSAPLIALLNDDTQVAPDWLAPLVAAMESAPRLGAAGSVIVTRGAITSAGHRRVADGYWEDVAALPTGAKTPFAVESVSGCAVLYRREALEQIGGLDESFVMYMEDVDAALRLAACGWTVACVPDSVVEHVHHGTATEAQAMFFTERNRLLLLAKHSPAELAAALPGRGYASHTGRPSSTPPELLVTEALVALVAHHPRQIAKAVLPEVLASVLAIASANDAPAAQYLRRLEREVATRSEMIAAKDADATALRAEIAARDQALVVKDEYASALRAEIAARDQALAVKDEYITDLERALGRKPPG